MAIADVKFLNHGAPKLYVSDGCISHIRAALDRKNLKVWAPRKIQLQAHITLAYI